jgi:hypothetical protein
MYLSDDGTSSSKPSPIFCLGATWSGADPADPYGAGLKTDDEAQLDMWKADHLTRPTIALNPAPQIPDWTPKVRRTAARRLNEYILGKEGNDSNVTPFLDPLFRGFLPQLPEFGDNIGLREYIEAISVIVKTDAKQPQAVSTEPNLLVSHSTLSPKLMEMLYTIIDALPSLTDPINLLEHIRELVRFYVTPHVFDPINQQELPLGAQSKLIIDPLAASLPAALLDSLGKKLRSLNCHLHHVCESTDDQIRFIEALYFIEDNKPYGRGSEAFPAYSLSYEPLPLLRNQKTKERKKAISVLTHIKP